jgi:hypothetical protein
MSTTQSRAEILSALRTKLAASAITEPQLLAWLKDSKAIRPGLFSIVSLPTGHLRVLVAEWDKLVLRNLKL